MVEDIAREQVIAAKISGVPPSMHLILSPNTDGDEAAITTADIIAGRSYLHKVDAVLVPKSMLQFLEDFTAKKDKKTKGKKGNTTISVTEALKGGNATGNATGKNATRKGSKVADEKASPTYLANATGTNITKNATAPGKATSGAADVAFTVLVTLPLLLASILVL